jgi:mono/diheme cytochrome c family protein
MLGRTFTPATGTPRAYDNLWKQWGLKEKPADYARAVRERYGLQPAPYDNQGLPMGLRYGPGLLLAKGITHDCMLCHSGSVAGQTVLGLGNASLDYQSFFEDMLAEDNVKLEVPFALSHVRGTIEAGAAVLYLMQYRDADLNIRKPLPLTIPGPVCEDVPAWWLLKKKKTMYHTGVTDSRSVRSLMPFMLSPLNSGSYIKKQEEVFAAMRAFILSLEPPKYPFPIDDARADRGAEVFAANCAKCHGTYGPDGKYPNKHVPLDVVGTDATLATGLDVTAGEYYLNSWFAQDRAPDGQPYVRRFPDGYQAPPLDGVWATAPYFHNGSVPTLYHVLNSKARPRVFTRSYGTGREDYDPDKVGWRITVLEKGVAPDLPRFERRKVYDTTQPGRGNGGHPFGDKLTDDERLAVLEYLKTL